MGQEPTGQEIDEPPALSNVSLACLLNPRVRAWHDSCSALAPEYTCGSRIGLSVRGHEHGPATSIFRHAERDALLLLQVKREREIAAEHAVSSDAPPIRYVADWRPAMAAHLSGALGTPGGIPRADAGTHPSDRQGGAGANGARSFGEGEEEEERVRWTRGRSEEGESGSGSGDDANSDADTGTDTSSSDEYSPGDVEVVMVRSAPGIRVLSHLTAASRCCAVICHVIRVSGVCGRCSLPLIMLDNAWSGVDASRV